MSGAAQPLKSAVRECLSQLGIARGDTVFLHSDAIVVAQFPGLETQERIHCLLDAIEEFLGTEGTLALPTFTYSFTKNEVFDRQKTPSTVGMITEMFRLRPKTRRNADPIFSVAASGAGAEEFANTNGRECFGPQSTFALLHRRNAWIAGLGCGFDRATFVHYVEKSLGVDYRYDKKFSGTMINEQGETEISDAIYFVRDLDRKTTTHLNALHEHLRNQRRLAESEFGRFRMWAVRSADFFDAATALLKTNPSALIEEGAVRA